MYRTAAVVAVMLKKVRYAISDDCIIEKKFPDEVNALRALPLPPVFRAPRCSGSGPRMNGHGAGSTSCRKQLRKLSSILRKITGTLTSVRRTGKMPPFRARYTSVASEPKTGQIRGMKSDNPVKGSFWQTDEGHFFRTGNRVHTHGKYRL